MRLAQHPAMASGPSATLLIKIVQIEGRRSAAYDEALAMALTTTNMSAFQADIMRVLPASNGQPISTAGIFQWLNIEWPTNVPRAVLSRFTIMVTVGLSALLFPCLSFAQTADDIFKRAHERFARR